MRAQLTTAHIQALLKSKKKNHTYNTVVVAYS
jgi:hypothetical protein